MEGFYWLIDGALAGCPQPGLRWRRSHGARSGDTATALSEDLAALRGRGIGAVLSLTEDALPPDAIEAAGLVGLHLPVPDFHAPTPDQLRAAMAFIDEHRADGTAVAIHCRAGQGRTGTVLAAYLIRGGAAADEAITKVRGVCPGAIESDHQIEGLQAYAARRDWVL